jgi:DNA polymerase-3 subunit epsilon
VRDVVTRHGGEFWFERERTLHRAFFRFSCPWRRDRRAACDPRPSDGGRPGVLRLRSVPGLPVSPELDERTLTEISYTVFDTEDHRPRPLCGDEIIQIGATRIVNGKLPAP